MNPLRELCARGSRSVAYSLGLSLLLSLPAPGVAGQDVLLGMNDVDQPGGPDELVLVDLPSGVATHLHTFPAGMNFLESLAYDARENVLWTTNDGILVRIDPMTYATAEVGDTGKSDIDGLAVHPSTGMLYGITHGGNDLLLIDKTDAGTSVINGSVEVGTRLEDLAFDPSGRLFVLTSRALVEVDPLDGTRIRRANLNGAESLEGLVWWSEGGVFLSAADRSGSKDMVSISLAGSVSFLGSQDSGFPDIEALAFVPDENQVPVTMQAVSSVRDAEGVTLVWRTHDRVEMFVVQRSRNPRGPWETIATLRSSQSRGEVHRFTDSEVSTALQGLDLHYRVGARDAAGSWTWLAFRAAATPVPYAATLHGNAPNPFNPSTTFRVELTQPARVHLQIHDVRGRLVHQQSASVGAGVHVLRWDGRDRQGNALASGVYPYLLRAGSQTLRARAVLAR
jgi:hypothetical protein